MQHDFQPFYGMVMPCLKFVLVTAKENYNCMLVAKSLECITVVAVAVGKSVFSADVEEVTIYNFVLPLILLVIRAKEILLSLVLCLARLLKFLSHYKNITIT